jgi:translation initiation factor 2 alpha subunit (eIF-2alpha)
MKISDNEYPLLNEYVLCKIIKYVELNGVKGAYCELIHYNNMEALLLPSEATKNKYQRIEKVHKIGNEIICEIYNIDNTHIDLSYKTITEEIEKKQKEKFIYISKICNIIKKIVDLYNSYYSVLTNNLYEILFLSKNYNMLNIDEIKVEYENYLTDPSLIFTNNICNLDESFINSSLTELQKYIQIIPYSILIEFNLFSIDIDGVNNIKKVLHNVFTDLIKNGYRLELHSLPIYNVIYNAINEKEIIDIMNNINNNLIKESSEHKCIVKINNEYKIIHQKKINLLL